MQGFLLQASELFSFHLTLMLIGNFNQDSFRHVRDSKGHYNILHFTLFCFFIVHGLNGHVSRTLLLFVIWIGSDEGGASYFNQ